MKKILHQIAHFFYVNSVEEIMIFNQSRDTVIYKFRCKKCGKED